MPGIAHATWGAAWDERGFGGQLVVGRGVFVTNINILPTFSQPSPWVSSCQRASCRQRGAQPRALQLALEAWTTTRAPTHADGERSAVQPPTLRDTALRETGCQTPRDSAHLQFAPSRQRLEGFTTK